MNYGYVRVSTREQKVDRQIEAMKEFSIKKKNIFIEKETGKDFNRRGYQELVKTVQKGDVLIIKSIDRLGRNYNEILEEWRLLTKTKEIDIVVLDMPLLDTREKTGSLTGTFIADMVLQILCYVAQTERENTMSRQAEGIEIAQKKGVKFGRPEMSLPLDFDEVVHQWRHKKMTVEDASELCKMSRSTFFTKVREKGL